MAQAAGPPKVQSYDRAGGHSARTVMAFRYLDLSQFSDTFWSVSGLGRSVRGFLGKLGLSLVLGTRVVKLLQNPIVFKMLFGAFVCLLAFLVAALVIRAMRKSMSHK